MQNEFRASWRSSYVSFSKLTLKIFKILKSIFSLKLKDACVENSIFSKVSLYLKPVGLLITIFLTKWTVKNPIGTFLFTIPFYTLTCGLSCLIIKFAEVSFFARTRHQVVNDFILGYGGVEYNHMGIDRL